MDCESDVTLWNSTWHISFTFFYVLIFDSRKSIRYDLSLYQFRWICNLTNTLGSQKGVKVDQNGKGAKPTNFQIKTNGIDFYPIRQFSSESWKYSRGLPTFFLSSMKIRLRCAGNFTNYFFYLLIYPDSLFNPIHPGGGQICPTLHACAYVKWLCNIWMTPKPSEILGAVLKFFSQSRRWLQLCVICP